MSEDLETLKGLIAKDLGLEKGLIIDGKTHVAILEALSRIISYLLDHDLSKLLQALYRIDVNEQAVKQILATEETSEMSMQIAQLILKRELEKVETRNLYR